MLTSIVISGHGDNNKIDVVMFNGLSTYIKLGCWNARVSTLQQGKTGFVLILSKAESFRYREQCSIILLFALKNTTAAHLFRNAPLLAIIC